MTAVVSPAPIRRPRFIQRAKGPLILFAIVAGMFWKLVFTRQYTWLNSPDVAGLVLPWFQLQASSLHRWSLALWDPYQWCGQPLAAQGQAGTLYPLNWILWVMPLHRTWLRHVYLNWYFVLIHLQAAVFAYWLCRDQGRSRAASILGGMAFTFGPFLNTSVWPAALNAAAWAPLTLLFFLRAIRNVRPLFSAAISGAALGAAWLSGSDEVPIALTLSFVGLWLWHRSRWKQMFIAAATAFGIGAMQILPGLEYLRYAPGTAAAQAGPAWEAKAIGPMGLVNLVMPGGGDPSLFIGCAILALAVIGVWRHGASKPIRMCLALAAAGIAIAVGPYVMLSGALYGARLIWKDPHSALCLLALALPIPAAAGLDAVRDGARPATLSRILLGAFVFSMLALFPLSMIAGDDLDRLSPLALFGLGALATYALIEARTRGAITARATGVLAILLAMWQFGHVSGFDWRNIEFGWPYLTRLADSADIAAMLRSQPSLVRIANPDRSAEFQVGDFYGSEQFDGLTGGTANIVSVADLPSARALGGTGFVISRNGAVEPSFQSASGMKLYGAPDPFPRAWVVNRVSTITSSSETRKLLGRPTAELRRAAFVTGPAPQTGSCRNPGTANLVSGKGRTVTIRAALPCPGLVIANQTWYPGWQASVDGKPAKTYEAYGFLTGIATPAGEHTVELVFRPWIIWIGAAITFTTALALLLIYNRMNRAIRVAG